jgi:hypothetical protein
MKSSIRLSLKRRALNRLFSSLYKDLLKAICNDNYESIESLCEQTLTLELAARMFYFEKYGGV